MGSWKWRRTQLKLCRFLLNDKNWIWSYNIFQASRNSQLLIMHQFLAPKYLLSYFHETTNWGSLTDNVLPFDWKLYRCDQCKKCLAHLMMNFFLPIPASTLLFLNAQKSCVESQDIVRQTFKNCDILVYPSLLFKVKIQTRTLALGAQDISPTISRKNPYIQFIQFADSTIVSEPQCPFYMNFYKVSHK